MSINRDEARLIDHRLEARLERSKKFRALYRYLGFTAQSLSEFLKVSEASVYRWQRDGNVPTLVLRFLRLHAHQKLPGKTWDGWHFSRGTLWSPEGHGFDGKDFSWLSLTLRRAESFGTLYKERQQLLRKIDELHVQLAGAEKRALTAESRSVVIELALNGALAGMAEPPRGRAVLSQFEVTC